jgi:HAD domain in Swiss Army Knife RNA repair proteins
MDFLDKVVFLDIDGVLNNHNWSEEAQSCLIIPECVAELNRVLRVTQAKVVVSSAWRYMILGGAMTLRGFSYMLQTHGVRRLSIVDTTVADESVRTRGAQIKHWVAAHAPKRYVVVDDDEYDFAMFNHPFVQTKKDEGLTGLQADRIIQYLNGGEL